MSCTGDTPHENHRLPDAGARWDKIRIDQFGYTHNLLLALATALLGYAFSLIRDKNFVPYCTGRIAIISVLALLGLSVFAGLMCAVSRLLDFKGTARRANEKSNAPSSEWTEFLGKLSWTLLGIQFAAFLLGGFSLGVAILVTYGGKLK
ncbi:MAG TPA: hypothetical protein VIJ79_03190 [Acidobacteriaceae bacterium]